MSTCDSLDIQDLIEAAHWAMRNEDTAVVPNHLSRYYKWLIQTIWDARKKCNYALHYIEYDDLMQQAYLIWLEAAHKYDTTKPEGISKKSYIKTRLVWGLRDWYISEMRIVSMYPDSYFQEQEPEFLLDLHFLVYGTKSYPYSLLTPFERYLIFLRYRQDKTILQIAHIIQRSRFHTSKCLNRTIDKLRRAFNASKDTAGHCQSRDYGGQSDSRTGTVQEKSPCSGDSDPSSKIIR